LSQWVASAEPGVGDSGLVQTYRRVFDEHPSFYETCLTDDRQIVLIVASNQEGRSLGLVRLFDIGLDAASAHAALETFVVRSDPGWLELGLEAACLACRYGLAVLGLRRIDARIPEDDPGGLRILQCLGFRQEGVLRQAMPRGGAYCDVLLLGLLADEARDLDAPASALVSVTG
jgi:RimJ/RimL family protein N-acetyltransferase